MKTKQGKATPFPAPRLSKVTTEFNPPLVTTPATAQSFRSVITLIQQAGDAPIPGLKGSCTNWIHLVLEGSPLGLSGSLVKNKTSKREALQDSPLQTGTLIQILVWLQ